MQDNDIGKKKKHKCFLVLEPISRHYEHIPQKMHTTDRGPRLPPEAGRHQLGGQVLNYRAGQDRSLSCELLPA